MPVPHSYHHQIRSPHHSLRETILSHRRLAHPDELLRSLTKRLSPQIRLILSTHLIFDIAAALGGIFVNIFLWRQSGDLATVVKYNLIQHPAILAIFILTPLIFYRFPARLLLQLGLVILALVYILFIFLAQNVVANVWFLGLLAGLGAGFYWVGYHLFSYHFTTDKNRDAFFGFTTSLGYLVSVVSPAVAGAILAQAWTGKFLAGVGVFVNYYLLFSLIVFVFIAGFFSLLRLPPLSVPTVDIHRLAESLKLPTWRLLDSRDFLDGLAGGSVGFLSAILAFIILGSEFNVGIYTSAFSLFSVLVATSVGGFIIKRRKERLSVGLLGASLLAIARIVYVALFNIFGLITSAAVGAFGQPLFSVGLAATYYDAIDHSPAHARAFYRYFILRETALAAGRTTSAFLFLVFLGFGADIAAARVWFLILGFVPLVFWFLTKEFEERFEG